MGLCAADRLWRPGQNWRVPSLIARIELTSYSPGGCPRWGWILSTPSDRNSTNHKVFTNKFVEYLSFIVWYSSKCKQSKNQIYIIFHRMFKASALSYFKCRVSRFIEVALIELTQLTQCIILLFQWFSWSTVWIHWQSTLYIYSVLYIYSIYTTGTALYNTIQCSFSHQYTMYCTML